jgi:probable rRNA maturation factor
MGIYIKNNQRSTRLNLQRIIRDLNRALRLLGFQATELSVLFIGSKRMKSLNSRYRGINKVTDVLSFPMTDKGPVPAGGLLGDIVICVPRSISQADDFGVSFYDELLRLMLHGLLHLVGYDHEKNSYQKRRMERKEEELLNAIKTMG